MSEECVEGKSVQLLENGLVERERSFLDESARRIREGDTITMIETKGNAEVDLETGEVKADCVRLIKSEQRRTAEEEYEPYG